MRRWETLRKGEEYFFGATPSPCDFWVLVDENKKLGALYLNPDNEKWMFIYNGEHHTSGRTFAQHIDVLTLEEAKAAVEKKYADTSNSRPTPNL